MTSRSVAVVTLGCARNEVDSEELAGRLSAQGWTLVDDASAADVAVINTCGFVEQAKKDSIDALLEANDLKQTGRTQAVVAVGCLAERYGNQLAEQLPEADAVLGFDSYQDMSSHLTSILAGSVRHRTRRATGASCCRCHRRRVGVRTSPLPATVTCGVPPTSASSRRSRHRG